MKTSLDSAWFTIKEDRKKSLASLVEINQAMALMSAQYSSMETMTGEAIHLSQDSKRMAEACRRKWRREADSKRMAEDNAGVLFGMQEKMASGGGVRFHDTSFNSGDDVIVYCKRNGIVKGCTGDAFVLLNFGRTLVMPEEEFLKKLKGRMDTDISSPISSRFSCLRIEGGSFRRH